MTMGTDTMKKKSHLGESTKEKMNELAASNVDIRLATYRLRLPQKKNHIILFFLEFGRTENVNLIVERVEI